MKQRKEKKFRRIDRRDALKWLKGEDRVTAEPKLYFGYGSNLDIKQMKRRCKDSVPITAGSLPSYRLSFSGVLTIEPHAEDFVVGGIYEVSPSDERALDRYEGFPHTYSKRYTHIAFNGARRPVFYYVLNPPYTLSTPMPYYYDIVAQGYKDWALDLKHLKASRKRAVKVEKRTLKKYYELDKRKWKGYTSYKPAYTVNPDGTVDYQEWADSFGYQEWAESLAADRWEGVSSQKVLTQPVPSEDLATRVSAQEIAEAEWSEAFDTEYKRIQAW